MFTTLHGKILTLRNFTISGIALLILLFISFFFASYIGVPWGDGLDIIKLFLSSNATTFIFTNINEHPIIVPRLLNFVDLAIGNVDFRFTALVTLALYLVQFLLICRFLLFVDHNTWNWTFAAVIAMTTFATYRLIVISNPINNAHFLVGFFVFMSLLSYAKQQKSIDTTKRALMTCAFLFGGLAILTLANGILLLPIILLIHLLNSRGFNKLSKLRKILYTAGLTLAAAAGVYIYVVLSSMSDTNIKDWTLYNLKSLLIFYIEATALPFTGLKTTYSFGIMFAAVTNLLSFYFIFRFVLSSKKSTIQTVSIGLILFSLVSFLLIAVYRYELYANFFSHGHRYGIFNLFLHIGLILLLSETLKEIRLGNRVIVLLKQGVVLLTILCVVGSYFVGSFLVERRYAYEAVSDQLVRGQQVDTNLFQKLGFYPSIHSARNIYKEFVKLRLITPSGP